MTFKVGDRIRRVREPLRFVPIGFETVVTRIMDERHIWYDSKFNGEFNGSASHWELISEATGPVRTVTRTVTETTIEGGTYGRLEVLRREGDVVVVGFVKNSIAKADSWTGLNAGELRAAAAVLLELAGALDSE